MVEKMSDERTFYNLNDPELGIEDFPFSRPVTGEAVYLLSESSSYRLPTPPTMRNHGNHVASICEIVRWLGEKAEGLGVNVFPGFPVDSLLVEGDRVIGVRTTPSGLDREPNDGCTFHWPSWKPLLRSLFMARSSRNLLPNIQIHRDFSHSWRPQFFLRKKYYFLQ